MDGAGRVPAEAVDERRREVVTVTNEHKHVFLSRGINAEGRFAVCDCDVRESDWAAQVARREFLRERLDNSMARYQRLVELGASQVILDNEAMIQEKISAELGDDA